MLQRNNTSGVAGISFRKKENKWSAYIRTNGKLKHLGLHEAFENAVTARKCAESLYDVKPRQFLTEDERRASAKKYRNLHREKLNKDRETLRRKVKQTNPLKICWQNKKSGAQQKGIFFDIALEDLTMPDVCAACNAKIFLFKGGIAQPDTACFDRIHPDKGYTDGNWQWLCNSCNMMKSNYADPELFLQKALCVYKNMMLHLSPNVSA